jgi:hypothetical protein
MVRRTFKKIKDLLAAGKFLMGHHAQRRAEERLIAPSDIRNVGKTANSCRIQDDGSYLVSGLDLDDEELTLVVKLVDDELFIKTTW